MISLIVSIGKPTQYDQSNSVYVNSHSMISLIVSIGKPTRYDQSNSVSIGKPM